MPAFLLDTVTARNRKGTHLSKLELIKAAQDGSSAGVFITKF